GYDTRNLCEANMSRIIETEADIAEGASALAAACEHMARVYAVTGPPPLRRRVDGFEGLARIITNQQLSVPSASAIWGRLEQAVRPMDAENFLRKRHSTLRECGLSAAKIATIGTIAKAISGGTLDLGALAFADDDMIAAQLTALKGVGPWSADIYIMFCIGRADAWAPGDLALKNAVQDACGLKHLPDEAVMDDMAEAWRPWRGVAARMLWAYYAVRRSTKSGAPV
ncbi:MAG: DNA-3-methyladenine glycosylase family protein, partial [Methyloligellaceae bacterium]